MYYSIKSVSELTGISALTLRNWERRFAFPKPSRQKNGYRGYKAEDIDLLKKVAARLKTGGRIAQIVDEFRATGDVELPAASVLLESKLTIANQLWSELFEALCAFDLARAVCLSAFLETKLNYEERLKLVYSPILLEIGKLWKSSKRTIAQEHFISSFVRMELFSLLNALPELDTKNLRSALMCTPEGELHEGGLLVLAVYLKLRGWRVIYLGSNCPLNELSDVVEKTKPDVVGVSIVNADNLDKGLSTLLKLKVPICIGGQGVSRSLSEISAKNSHVHFSPSKDLAAVEFIELIAKKKDLNLKTPSNRG